MTAKTSTDAPAPVTTGSDNGVENIEPLRGSTDPLITRFDYAGGMRDLLNSFKSLNDPKANSFLPDTSFAPFKVAEARGLTPNLASDASPPIVLAQLKDKPLVGPEGDLQRKPATLDPQIQKRIDEIQKKYNITITPPGVFLGNQENLCGPQSRDKPRENPKAPSAIHSRIPTTKELDALEQALNSTGDSSLTRDGKPLKITFTDKPAERSGRADTGEGALYNAPDENNGIAELRINPSPKILEPLLPHMLRHEIGHNAEQNAYTNGKHPAEVLDKLGFKTVPNPFYSGSPGEPAQLDAVRVNNNGREMYFIKLPPDCQNPRGTWLRLNEQGQLLSKSGNVVPMRNGQPDPRSSIIPYAQSDKLMQSQLTVKHPTPYFDNPNEVITESFATWSGLSGAARTTWEQKYPNHFEAVKTMLEAQKRNLGR